MRAILLVCVGILWAGCAGAPRRGSVLIGVERYDDFFRDANGVLAEWSVSPSGERRRLAVRERARTLGAEALELLETVDREVKADRREGVREALREAAVRLAAVH